MTTVDEVNNDKTKLLDEIVSISVSLVCFTTDVHVSLSLKLWMQTNTCFCVLCFSPLFCSPLCSTLKLC